MEHENAMLLEMRGIGKSFPGVQALQNVSLQLRRGEVLALVGENGEGKSTLMKILGGAHPPDAGEIRLNGHPIRCDSPATAQRAGISLIYQEFNLIPDLTVRENLFLGRERTHYGRILAAEERQEAQKLFGRLRLHIDPEARCRDLSVAQQQKVEIAEAISIDAQILVMDEPTAALGPQEAERLFSVIRELKQQDLGIIYISHRLEEVFLIADRVLVLRDGAAVADHCIQEFSRESLIEKMVGRPMQSEFPKRSAEKGAERLRVKGLTRGRGVEGVSFVAHAGEVLGFAGLVGAGRTETMRLIFGADRAEAGQIWVDGRPVVIRHPRDAVRHRICLLTEDRKRLGLVLNHSIRENFGLPNLRRFHRGPFIDGRKERAEFARYVQSLRIKITDPEQPAQSLSGGNQQKVVLAKWLASHADVVIFDEPTRGIDVGAKYEIYLLINQLAADGKAILMVSSELPELLGMSDRILVMHDGQVRGEITDRAIQHKKKSCRWRSTDRRRGAIALQRFFRDYGMVLVLLALCVLFSDVNAQAAGPRGRIRRHRTGGTNPARLSPNGSHSRGRRDKYAVRRIGRDPGAETAGSRLYSSARGCRNSSRRATRSR